MSSCIWKRGAVLRFTDDFDAYPVVNIRWEGYEQPCRRPLIYAKNEVNVALTGFGTLEGQGKKWWTAFRAKTLDAARRARSALKTAPACA